MRKAIVIFIISIIMFSSSFAYEPTAKDTKALNSIYGKIDIIYDKKPESVKKLYSQITTIKNKYKNQEKLYYLLSELETYIYNKINKPLTNSNTEIENNTFETIGRSWKINEIRVFDDENVYVSEGKKLVGVDLSYINTLGTSYNFPGNYSVYIKFKDNSGFEYIWEDMDYIATSMKAGILGKGESKRGWLFIEIDNEIENGNITFTYNENGIEKTLYKNIEIPKLKEKIEEENEKEINVGLNEKFTLDGIEYEITNIRMENDLGSKNYPKTPKNDTFLILEYSYKNIDNENQYPGNFKLKLGEYIYDESSAVTSYGYNLYGYYGGGSNKVMKGTKRDTYTGFDIKNDVLENATLVIEAWGYNEKKILIPFKNLLK